MSNNDKHEVIKFTITCTMKRRWAEHFLGMLVQMQKLGNLGSSRNVTLFADGDGDFKPKFETYTLEGNDILIKDYAIDDFGNRINIEGPIKTEENDDTLFDAG